MKKIYRSTLLAALLTCGAAFGQENQEQQEEQPPQHVEEDEMPPPKPPRVVGEAQTQAEFEAWQVLEQAENPAERAALAEKFLEAYPESGLTPFVHHILARYYYGSNEIEKFVTHAEKTLEELPNSPDLLSPLAFVYSEQGQTQKALQLAERALRTIEDLEKPANVPAIDWLVQGQQVRADAYYALGRAHLNRFNALNPQGEGRATDPSLAQAIENFRKAAEHDPRHDYAYFRLGFSETNANNPGSAMEAYARAVAVGGVAAGLAQSNLEDIHAFVIEHMSDSELAQITPQEFVDREARKIQMEVAALEQKISAEAARIEEEERAREEERLRKLMEQLPEPSEPDPPGAN
ncbi:MAG TPA: tetratricopeptide repeat-containing protein [Acidobacteriota bacterium]|nr:tetratricopeptide repeat-containing protein [Acidobacteriota bacterium]